MIDFIKRSDFYKQNYFDHGKIEIPVRDRNLLHHYMEKERDKELINEYGYNYWIKHLRK